MRRTRRAAAWKKLSRKKERETAPKKNSKGITSGVFEIEGVTKSALMGLRKTALQGTG